MKLVVKVLMPSSAIFVVYFTILNNNNIYNFCVALFSGVHKEVSWCFTPSQPVPLYQGDLVYVNNFCIALFSGVHKLAALYGISTTKNKFSEKEKKCWKPVQESNKYMTTTKCVCRRK